jgi:hypothetical protein
VHTLALEDASHPTVTVPADAVPLLARVFAPVTHLQLFSANPVALAIEATKTVCVRGSPGVFALGAGAVDHAATGVALQALVGAALGACTKQRDALTAAGVHTSCALHPAATAPVDTALLLVHVFALPRPHAPRHTSAARHAPRARRRRPCGARDRGNGDCVCAWEPRAVCNWSGERARWTPL